MFLALNQVASMSLVHLWSLPSWRSCSFLAKLADALADALNIIRSLWSLQVVLYYILLFLFYWYFLPTFWSFGSDSGLSGHEEEHSASCAEETEVLKGHGLEPHHQGAAGPWARWGIPCGPNLKYIAIESFAVTKRHWRCPFSFLIALLLLLAFLR